MLERRGDRLGKISPSGRTERSSVRRRCVPLTGGAAHSGIIMYSPPQQVSVKNQVTSLQLFKIFFFQRLIFLNKIKMRFKPELFLVAFEQTCESVD